MIERRIVYHSPDGKTFDSSTYPTGLVEWDGIYTPGTVQDSQVAPFQDGSTYIGTTLQDRELVVTLGYFGSFDVVAIQNWKRNIQRVCNPKTNDIYGSGYADITENGVTRRVYCVVDSVASKINSRRNGANDVILTFLCNDPYMYGDTSNYENVSFIEATFEFAPDFEFDPDIEFGTAALGGVLITNDGDVPASHLINIAGPCVDPYVTNVTTGEFVGFDLELLAGDEIIIDVASSIVELNGASAIQYLDVDSVFWKLIPGDNQVALTATTGQTTATCGITWKDPYIGF